MYEKTIKFKLEKKFFNSAGYLDNKYIYDWLNLAKKYYESKGVKEISFSLWWKFTWRRKRTGRCF